MWTALNTGLRRNLPALHAVLKAAAGPWMRSRDPLFPAIRRIGGSWVRVHPRILASDIARTEEHVVGWIGSLLRAGDTFFDVGANCGWLSLRAARTVGTGGRVVAFEPAPALVELLRYHKRVNRVPQLTIVPKAVSDGDSPAVPFFLVQDGFSTRNSLTIGTAVPFLRPEDKRAVPVPALTLDAYCMETGIRPSFVKIDVEGAELMVLRGAVRLLESRPALIVATHPHWLPAGQTTEQLFDLLAGYGYTIAGRHVTRYAGYEIGDYLLV